MRKNLSVKIMIIGLALVTLMSGLTACAKPAAAQTISGYLIDVHCAVKKPDPAADSKACLNMAACAATGYGIAIPQDDKTYKFYFFDGDFAPAATDSQILAATIAAETVKNDHIYVTVTGTLTGAKKKYLDQSYPVMKVTSLVESNE